MNRTIYGTPASPGICGGFVKKIDNTVSGTIPPNYILFLIDSPYSAQVGQNKYVLGVITNTGGRTSHVAIICRELGIPCVTGVPEQTIDDGQYVTINGKDGTITIES
jgi:phosphoenolpyruvate-protein kinase (PTS system EI component)